MQMEIIKQGKKYFVNVEDLVKFLEDDAERFSNKRKCKTKCAKKYVADLKERMQNNIDKIEKKPG